MHRPGALEEETVSERQQRGRETKKEVAQNQRITNGTTRNFLVEHRDNQRVAVEEHTVTGKSSSDNDFVAPKELMQFTAIPS
ncbi:MAG TPA: hypothetical protein VNG32_00920, partial [Candidatus Dormibacteraeota bacterium]|nr:hypothetical protein [Candidatus Dormibacteraeota bacterium]